MKVFRAERARRIVNGCMDAAFVLFLLSEWLLRYTLASRVCLALFALTVLVAVVQRRKLYLSYWFAFSALFILWGALGLSWSADRARSADMLQTLLVNFAFALVLFQYYLLRADVKRNLRLVALAGFLFFLCVAAQTDLAELMGANSVRFGVSAGVNPNDVAIAAVFCFGVLLLMSTYGRKRSALRLLLLPIPLLVLALAGSLKGFVFAAGVCVLFLLLQYPRRWYIKAALLLCAGAVLLWILVKPDCMAYFPAIYYRVTLRLRELLATIFSGPPAGSSASERAALIERGRYLFADAPFTGHGLDSFCAILGAGWSYSHNNYIELLVSGGIPMLLLYYLPWLALLTSGVLLIRRANRWADAKKRRETGGAAKLLFTFVLLMLPLDYAMVSYFDRTTLLMPLLLLAHLRLEGRGAEQSELDPFLPYLRNPFYIFAYLSSRGRLRRLSDRRFIRLVYRGCLGVWPNLDAPKKYTEKLQYLKLHDHNPLYPTLCDKLAVRDFVSERVGKEYLVPLLGVWEDPARIRFWELPPRYVLKCTHDSGSVRVCTDKASFDQWGAVRFLKKRLKRNYFYTGREWAYRDVPPRVLAEAFIGGADGALPDDYKIFCFEGKPRAICFCTNRRKGAADYYFMTPEWALLPVNDKSREAEQKGLVIPAPCRLAEMLRVAEALSTGLPQLRVDLYESAGKLWFGELTLYDQSGFADDYVGDGDLRMGEWLTIV